MLIFPVWDAPVICKLSETARFAPPAGQTCGEYMAGFLQQTTGYLQNPDSATECAYCIYSRGSEYLATLELSERYYGYRDIGITVIFCLSSYSYVANDLLLSLLILRTPSLVFILMKLRSKSTKTAS
jgi:ATP-binding cassette subfamily G (WHITE) protein 2 (SNQ2)